MLTLFEYYYYLWLTTLTRIFFNLIAVFPLAEANESYISNIETCSPIFPVLRMRKGEYEFLYGHNSQVFV